MSNKSVEVSLILKLQVSMCYEHTRFSVEDLLTLAKFWLSLLWQSGDELTWAFGDIDEELFSDACDQFDLQQILSFYNIAEKTTWSAFNYIKHFRTGTHKNLKIRILYSSATFLSSSPPLPAVYFFPDL